MADITPLAFRGEGRTVGRRTRTLGCADFAKNLLSWLIVVSAGQSYVEAKRAGREASAAGEDSHG